MLARGGEPEQDPGADLAELSTRLGAQLRANSQTIATAESCTGGAIAAALTAIAGSSDYFPGGIISYSNAVKHELLDVAQVLLNAAGPVSWECAEAMAVGARARLGSDFAVATTGIAGPGGAEPGKPVGLVYVAVAGPNRVLHERHHFAGDRAGVIAAATMAALRLTLAVVSIGNTGNRH